MDRQLVEHAILEHGFTLGNDGVVHGVALLRSSSGNNSFGAGGGRRYTSQALASVARLANGAKAFFDHPTKTEDRERDGVRSVKDLAGYFSGARVDPAGVVRADFHPVTKDIAFVKTLVNQMADK